MRPMRTTHDVQQASGGAVRWHARYRAAVSADVAGAGVLLYHPVENLSRGGACVETPLPEQTGSRVDVTLDLGDGAPPMRLAARVVWAQRGSPGRMGLSWRKITAAQERRLAARLARNQASEVSEPGDSRGKPSA